MDVGCCAICKGEVLDNRVVLTQRGVDGLNEASKERGDTVGVVLGDTVYKNCRRHFTRPSSVRKAKRSHKEADNTHTCFVLEIVCKIESSTSRRTALLAGMK